VVKSDIAIRVSNLYKSFNLPHEKVSSVKGIFLNTFRRRTYFERQAVLKGINFEIERGEFFGIVGRNGSGKSTLLKLLAGIYSPDQGSIDLNGKLTPFIELGVGFSPELSGRENVYLNGALLGFNRKEMDDMYDDIVDFAELKEHMDKKLKNYSSGMQVRLAFSIAIKAKNEILIFDEVLAVGDEAFQQKCIRVFEEYRRNKQTVVLVTHDMNTVRNLCTRAMLIDGGVIKHIGTVESVSEQYSELNNKREDAQQKAFQKSEKQGKSKIIIDPPFKKVYLPSEELTIKASWLGRFDSTRHIIGVAIVRSDGEYIFGSNTRGLALAKASVSCTLKLDIGVGRYSLLVGVLDKTTGEMIDRREKAFTFTVIDDGRLDAEGATRLSFVYVEDKQI
jgi:ABC-2 type transport system ATP-binding protein